MAGVRLLRVAHSGRYFSHWYILAVITLHTLGVSYWLIVARKLTSANKPVMPLGTYMTIGTLATCDRLSRLFWNAPSFALPGLTNIYPKHSTDLNSFDHKRDFQRQIEQQRSKKMDAQRAPR